MILPIKINQNCLPEWLQRFLLSVEDPRKLLAPDTHIDRFERCVTAIKVGSTWKSTRKRRHILTDRLIADFATSLGHPLFLDIGASTGSTSLELIDRLNGNFNRYYVTDLSFTLKIAVQDRAMFIYHPQTNKCIMRVTDYFIIYEDVHCALFPLGVIASKAIRSAPRFDSIDTQPLNIVHPVLKQRSETDSRIIVREYNVFNPWPLESVDVIKAANVLNRNYFSENEIKKALINLKNALHTNGKLIITDNRDIEKVSMFSKNEADRLILEKEINGGSDISNIVIEV